MTQQRQSGEADKQARVDCRDRPQPQAQPLQQTLRFGLVEAEASARGERQDLLGFSETWYPRYHYGWSELTAVRDGRYKFIAAPRRELYDTQADPGEQHDIAASNPRVADALERALADMTAKLAVAATPQKPRLVEPEVEERLRSLGYVAATVSRATLADRIRGDPKDKIGLYNLLKRAAQDSVDGRLDEGIAKVREVLAADPEQDQRRDRQPDQHVDTPLLRRRAGPAP